MAGGVFVMVCGFVMGRPGRSLVSMVRSVIPMVRMGVMVRMRSLGRRMIPMMDVSTMVLVSGMIVVRRMGVMIGVRGLDRCVLFMGRVCSMVVGRGMTVVRRLSRRMTMVIGRGVAGIVMAGVMRVVRVVRSVRIVRVVRLVFVAHVTPVPQPLFTVFDRETGIT